MHVLQVEEQGWNFRCLERKLCPKIKPRIMQMTSFVVVGMGPLCWENEKLITRRETKLGVKKTRVTKCILFALSLNCLIIKGLNCVSPPPPPCAVSILIVDPVSYQMEISQPLVVQDILWSFMAVNENTSVLPSTHGGQSYWNEYTWKPVFLETMVFKCEQTVATPCIHGDKHMWLVSVIATNSDLFK